MKRYYVNAPVLCGIDVIAHQGDTIELDENEPATKSLEGLNIISPVETQEAEKTTKTKK